MLYVIPPRSSAASVVHQSAVLAAVTFAKDDERQKGREVGLFFVRNAIKVCPIGTVNLLDQDYNIRDTFGFKISDSIRKL